MAQLQAASDAITIHCWWPDTQSLLAGFALAGGVGTPWSCAELFGHFTLLTNLLLAGCLLLIGYRYTYCRVQVTLWQVRHLENKLLLLRVGIAIDRRWLLPEWAANLPTFLIALNFSSEKDFDTNISTFYIAFYGKDIFNCFRTQHLISMMQTLTYMALRRTRLATNSYAEATV